MTFMHMESAFHSLYLRVQSTLILNYPIFCDFGCKQYGSDRSITSRRCSYIFITPCIKLQQLCNLQNYQLTVKSMQNEDWDFV